MDKTEIQAFFEMARTVPKISEKEISSNPQAKAYVEAYAALYRRYMEHFGSVNAKETQCASAEGGTDPIADACSAVFSFLTENKAKQAVIDSFGIMVAVIRAAVSQGETRPGPDA